MLNVCFHKTGNKSARSVSPETRGRLRPINRDLPPIRTVHNATAASNRSNPGEPANIRRFQAQEDASTQPGTSLGTTSCAMRLTLRFYFGHGRRLLASLASIDQQRFLT